jgi:hypothetical protein
MHNAYNNVLYNGILPEYAKGDLEVDNAGK